MTESDLRQLAISAAAQYELDSALVQAICRLESGWDSNATRYEPEFFQRYIAPMVLPSGLIKGFSDPLEPELRATSIGLMQVMGQTAREQGYEGGLIDLKIPVNGVDMGCRKLARCFKVKSDVQSALLMYNGGGNPDYPGLVLQYYDQYKGEN